MMLNIGSSVLNNGWASDFFALERGVNTISIEHFLLLSLWHRSLRKKVGKKQNYYKSWSTKGIQKVRNLMGDESKCLSFTEFKERYCIKPNFLTFSGVVLFMVYQICVS